MPARYCSHTSREGTHARHKKVRDLRLVAMLKGACIAVSVCLCRRGASTACAGSTPSPGARGSSTAGLALPLQRRRAAAAARTWRRPLRCRKRDRRGKGLRRATTHIRVTTTATTSPRSSGCGWHREGPVTVRCSSRTTWPTGQSSWTTGFDTVGRSSYMLRVNTCSSSYFAKFLLKNTRYFRIL